MSCSSECGAASSVGGAAAASDGGRSFSLRLFKYGGWTDNLLTATAVTLNFVAGLGWPVFLLLYAQMVNVANGVPGRELIWYFKLTMICGGVAFVVCWFGATTMEWAAERQTRAIRSEFMRGITRQEMGWFDKFDGGQLATKLSESVKLIRESLGLKSTQLCYNLGVFLGAYIVSFTKSWKMTLVVSCMLPIMICCNTLMVQYLAKAGTAGREAYASAGGVAQEAFGAIRTIASLGLETKIISEFTTHCNESFRHALRGSLTVALGLGISLMSDVVTQGIGFWYGTKLTADDIDKFGYDVCMSDDSDVQCFNGGRAITVVHTLVTGVYAISQVGPCLAALARATNAVLDIEKISSRQSLIDPQDQRGLKHPPTSTSDRLQGHIQFKDVTFAYPTRPNTHVFKNFNLTIPAGKTVALVGTSGCGKSTIIQLLERFYDPTDNGGSILLDGVDLRDYNVKWLRSQIALVSQEPRLLAASIRDNIKSGLLGVKDDLNNIPDSDIVSAAKRANAHSFIQEMPRKYSTYCGEGGTQLSGGQKQRIAIARAIIRDPAILILDEATSALDNESERIVQNTLEQIVAEMKRTTIVIAHRLSTVRKADLIIVLDLDKDSQTAIVAEQGTHESLMAIDDGLYHNLVLNQIEDDDNNANDPLDDIVANFADDLPQRQLSSLRLRQKFSNRSRTSSILQDGTASKSISKAPSKATVQEEEATTLPSAATVGWKQVLKVLKPWWGTMGLGTISAIICGCSWPGFAIVMGKFIQVLYLEDADEIRSGGRLWGPLFFVYALIMGGSTIAQNFFFQKNGARLVQVLRLQTFKSIMFQDMEFFDRPENATGNLAEVLSADILVLQGWVGENLGVYIRCATTVIVAVIISFSADLKVGAVSLASFCILAPALVLQYKFGGYSRAEDTVNRGEGQEGAGFVVNETISNIRMVAAYSLEDHMIDRYQKIIDQDYAVGRKKCFIIGIAYGFVIGGQWYGQGLGYWYGATRVQSGDLSAEQMWRAVLSFVLASYCIAIAMAFSVDHQAARRAGTRVWDIKERKPKIDAQSDEGKIVQGLQEELRFDTVRFRYPQRPTVPIYDGLSFELKKGEVVALVGPSGCGKSTAVQLIERFYDVSDDTEVVFRDGVTKDGDKVSLRIVPPGGAISLDGVDIRDINLRSLRSIIGLVSQEPVLFNRSIAENISMVKENGATLDEVTAAYNLANAHSFITSLPDGYDTKVGKGGSSLSGGQKQRIAIARALIRNPSILVLDEATSALDSESEKIVQAALDDLLENHRTSTIVIAHRLSTVRNADKIVVLSREEGQGSKVAEVGTHSQLMDIPDGLYRRLVEIAQHN